MSGVVTRFAPSPNGRLHLGHAYSALFAARFAQAHGGRFLLRMEDIDVTRARPEFVIGIFEDLRWLGLTWPEPVLFQSAHLQDYCRALHALRRMGLLYPCHCTRRQVRANTPPDAPRDPDGAPLYPGTCRHRQHDGSTAPCADIGWRPGMEPMPPAWRLDMDKALALAERKAGGTLTWREEGAGPHGESRRIAAEPWRWGDVILGRRDIGVSYHVAVVVDDARQGVTHVTRGQDLFHATAIHRLLQVLLELPEPVYVHHRLITDVEGRKLSKSAGDTALATLRAQGMRPADIIAHLPELP